MKLPKTTLIRAFSALAGLHALAACNTYDVGSEGGGSGGEDDETGEVDTAEGADSTGEVADGDGESGGVPCGYPGMLGGDYDVSFPSKEEEDPDFELLVVGPAEEDGDCDFDGIFDPSDPPGEMSLGEGAQFEIFVYHPIDGEDWPDGLDERPAVFLGPGNGSELVAISESDPIESDHYYSELIQTLVADGFVVFGINPLIPTSMSSGERRAALACAMIWARAEWPDSARLSDFMVLAGHSRSGGGAYLLTEHLLTTPKTDLPENESDLDDWQQCALVTYAQRYGPPASMDEIAVGPITQESAPPFLSMLGTVDGDTRTSGVAAYDNRLEEAADGPLEIWDEVVVVVHGLLHESWGGKPLERSDFGPFFTHHFLQWQMIGEDDSRRRFMDLIDVGVDSCAFDVPPLNDLSQWWEGDQLEIYYSGFAMKDRLIPTPAVFRRQRHAPKRMFRSKARNGPLFLPTSGKVPIGLVQIENS